jgi:ABC-type nitrate/sulfonate/bicarbonate transport system substrate-binding protein
VAGGPPAVAATQAAGAPEVKALRYQGWSGLVLYPELAEDLGYLAPLKLNWVGNTTSGPQDIQSVVTGDVDFGGAFNGSIDKLIVAGAPITAVLAYIGTDAESFSGVYVANGSPIRSARDLLNKRIGVNTLGAFNEWLVTDYLLKSGLTPAEVKRITLVAAPPVNEYQLLHAGQIDAAVLQDVVRLKALELGGIRPLFTDYQLLGSYSYGTYVLRADFIARNPVATRRFVEGTARAIEWARTHSRDEVIARMRAIIAKRHRNEDSSIVSYWHSTGVARPGGLLADTDFTVFSDWYVKIGALKAGQFDVTKAYTNEFNPYRPLAH